MKQILLILSLSFFVFSCKKETDKESCSSEKNSKDKKFEMYEMSEMASLMEQMYVDNQRLKERIQKGDTIGAFPNHFLQIHKAVMTDKTENDAFFKEQAAQFIKAQELIYEDPKNAKQHFNEGVNACINCHEVECSGPIPRIKKLYIK
jgi:cytochrome c553